MKDDSRKTNANVLPMRPAGPRTDPSGVQLLPQSAAVPAANPNWNRRDPTPTPHSTPDGDAIAAAGDLLAAAGRRAAPGPAVASTPTAPPATIRRRGPFVLATVVLLGGTIAVAVVTVTPGASTSPPAPPTPHAATPLAAPASPAARGVTADTITLGMSAAFSGSARELGGRMKLGLETAFFEVNDVGGVAGRKLKLLALDDGYEGPRALANVKELIDRRGVFAILGNVGTPTTAAALPYVKEAQTLFLGALTGARVSRPDPPDDHIWNFRPAYEVEIRQIVTYLVDDGRTHAGSVRHVPDGGLVVFAQTDSYGNAGFEAVQRVLRLLGRHEDVLRVGYDRGTVRVDDAIARVLRHDASTVRTGPNEFARAHPVVAVVAVGTAAPTAAFVRQLRDHRVDAEVYSVSFVDAAALAELLGELGPRYCPGVVVTEVVPHPGSGAPGVERYRAALHRYHSELQPDPITLEGYLTGQLFVEAVRRAGRELTTASLIQALRGIQNLDLGIGDPVGFSATSHDASQRVWATALDERCQLQPFDEFRPAEGR